MAALNRIWRFLGRAGVASWLLFLLLLLSLLGSFLPQLSPSITRDPQRLSDWLAAAQDRYGQATRLLSRWGAFRLFHSPAYAILIIAVGLSTLSCTLRRWRAAWHRAFRRPVRCPDSLLEPGPHVTSLQDVSLARLQEMLKERGYRVQTASEDSVTHLRADRQRLSNLATLLTHVAVLLLAAGYALSGWLGWQAQVEVGPWEVTAVGHETGLAVRSEGFTIDHYPDGSVADYRARAALLKEDRVVHRGTVEVNHPLRFGGVGLYLKGFQESEGETRVIFLVARDPGTGFALAGGLLLLAGITATLYLPHRRIYARFEQDQCLLIARSSGRDDDPEPELASLARELTRC